MTEERKSKEFVAIYTDGSCLGNPGPGGWAAILVCRGVEREISGGHTKTTNNRMELMAVVKALQALKRPCKVEITSDSSYVVNAIEKGWLKNWVDKNTLKDRPNNDLWAELLILLDRHDIKFKWIKGHAGHPYNERCDEMAVRMSNKAKNSLVDHYEGTYNDDIEVLEAEFASEVDALEWVANHAVKMESIVEVEYGVVLTYSRKYKYPNSRNDASNKEVKANTGISQFEKRKKQQKYEEEQMRKTEENKQWVVCTRIDNSELFITPKGTAFIESEATLFTEESARLKAKALTNNSKRGYIWGIKRVRITHR